MIRLSQAIFYISLLSGVSVVNAQTITLTYSSSGERLIKTLTGTQPSPVISGVSNICLGDTNTLIVTGGSSYLWSTGSTDSVINVIPTQDSIFSVVATALNGCTASVSHPVYVHPLPEPDTINHQGISVVGISDTFDITTTAGSTYNWYVDPLGGTITSGNGTDQIIVDWTNPGFYVISVIQTTQFGCIGDTTFFIASVIINAIQEETHLYNFTVFPNPSTGNPTISFSLPSDVPIQLSFYNDTGKLIFKLDKNKNPTGNYSYDINSLLDDSQLAAGVYYIKLLIDTKNSLYKKVIVIK
jgi:hypothetical protein